MNTRGRAVDDCDDIRHALYVGVFFFQAEDGIRDLTVTGVQTCALPIFAVGRSKEPEASPEPILGGPCSKRWPRQHPATPCRYGSRCRDVRRPRTDWRRSGREIGRASCRERVEISVGFGSLKEKR